MASYASIENSVTEVIDDSFFNLAFIRKERHYFTQDIPNVTYYTRIYDVDVTGVEHPVVAFSSVCACCYYGLTQNKVTVVVGAFNQQNIPNAVSLLNNPTNYVDIYIFGRPTDNTPNIGFKIWNAQGKLVFDANHRYMQPVQSYYDESMYSPVAGGTNPFNSNKTITLPSGKKYAAYPLNRIFNIRAEYVSSGFETFWQADIYSSAVGINGGSVYLTSNKVDQVEDTSVSTFGLCRHHYFFIDVTNL